MTKPSVWFIVRWTLLWWILDEHLNHRVLARLGLFSRRYCDWTDGFLLESNDEWYERKVLS